MGGVISLLLVMAMAYLIMLVGATAYELTGLDRTASRFQALSAFTGAGFTTRVSELVVRHPVRRRITSTLIILGYGGTAGAVASLLESFRDNSSGEVLTNLGVVSLAVFVGWWVVGRVGPGLGDLVRRMLMPRLTGDNVPHEELMLYKRGYGITRIEVPAYSRVAGRRLRDLDLREFRLQVLAVEEDDDVHPIPNPDWKFAEGQHLIVYGRIASVQQAFGPAAGLHDGARSEVSPDP